MGVYIYIYYIALCWMLLEDVFKILRTFPKKKTCLTLASSLKYISRCPPSSKFDLYSC